MSNNGQPLIKPKVLVVDDERVIADTLAIILNQNGFDASAVYTGSAAVDLATARNAGVRICLARYGFGFADVAPETLRGDELIVDEPRQITSAVQ